MCLCGFDGKERQMEKNGEHPFGDMGQLIIFFVFLTVWVLDSFWLHFTTFLSNVAPLYTRLGVMAIIFIVSLVLIGSGHKAVHQAKEGGGVISDGAFGYIRHPLYLGTMLFFLAMAVATASLVSLALIVMVFFFYNYIASYEEKLLEKKYGESYVKYKTRTGRWFPRLRRNGS